MSNKDNQGRPILTEGSSGTSHGDKVKVGDGNGGWKPATMVGGTAVETK